MKLVWSQRSRADILRQEERIAQDNPMAAGHVVNAIEDAAQILGAFPRAGRPTGRPLVRALIEGRYRYKIVYQIHEKAGFIRILRVFHPRQNRP